MDTVNNLLSTTYQNSITLTLLKNGGVDDWEWYDTSLENLTEEELNDSNAFLNALENGGVDNWEWYDESLTDLFDYNSYLDSFENENDEAYDFYEWQNHKDEIIQKPIVENPAETEPTVEKSRIQSLISAISEIVGEDRAIEVYDSCEQAGILKRNVFPKEFGKAIKNPTGGKFSMSAVQETYVNLIRGKKLKGFIDSL